ncbi:MAG TPA: DUF2393 family protein [Granulicella sp.]|jgi:hypothetical protein|nr:DUF2393 family protein [Granulicella sp.]
MNEPEQDKPSEQGQPAQHEELTAQREELTAQREELTAGRDRAPVLFAPKAVEESRRRWLLVAGLGLLIVVAAVVLSVRGHKGGVPASANQILPLDPYAGKLAFSQLAMSQSTSLSGGTSTFIDGKVRNSGERTATGVTVQVLFRNDEGLAPQVETLPLSLIRAHEPYVDTEPVSAAPLKPGDEKEFRLIFESVPENWNRELPEIHVVKVVGQ